jgi:hypothetical protein
VDAEIFSVPRHAKIFIGPESESQRSHAADLKATPRTLSAFESFLNFFSRIQSSKLVGRKCELRGQVEG